MTENLVSYSFGQASNEMELPKNYIYISHLDEGFKFWYLPFYPDNISDTMRSSFVETSALGRTAPVYTFANAGPRTVQFSMTFHRDILDEANINKSNSQLDNGEDYSENLIRALQSIAVPKYNLTNKTVEPPLVAVRLGDAIFIKGVVTNGIGVSYEKPILSNNKYAVVTITLMISEVDPYDATSVFKNGSFRGLVSTLEPPWGMTEGD